MTDGALDVAVVEEAVARRLCSWAEYHEGNWRLYLHKAREIVALCHESRTALPPAASVTD